MRGLRFLFQVLAVAAAGALVGCGSGVDPDAPLPTWEERDVLFVDPEVLHEWMEGGNAEDVVFVDNRAQFVYEEQRIAGARLIPTGVFEDNIGSLPVNKWLVMYCT